MRIYKSIPNNLLLVRSIDAIIKTGESHNLYKALTFSSAQNSVQITAIWIICFDLLRLNTQKKFEMKMIVPWSHKRFGMLVINKHDWADI